MKSASAFVAIALSTLSLVACSATTDDASAPEDPSSEIQDQELRRSLTACNVDADCVAVPRGGCCSNGWNEAVNKHHVKAYENATKCKANPPPLCPMYIVNDTRVARCDAATHQCKMVALPTASLDGSWGADNAILTIASGHGDIEFGCGHASIDTFTFSSANAFTATGTYTRGTGVQPPPGMEPKPQPATFKGTVAGNTLTLEMSIAGSAPSTYVFTRNRTIQLMRCL